MPIYCALLFSTTADHTSKKGNMTGNYLTDFDPWACLESSRTNVNLLTEGHELRFTLDGLHDVFSDGKSLVDLNFGRALVWFGLVLTI